LFQPLPNGEFLIIGSGKIIKLNAELKPVYELDFKQRVYSATPEENGHVYVITDPARILYEIDSKGNMSPFKGEVKDRKQKVNRFGIDIKGRLWIEGIDSKISVYQNGIRVLNPKTFILGPDSTILVGADVGLFILDPKTDTVLPYKKYNEFENLGKLAINSFAEINGLYYVSTEKGLYLLDWEKGIVAHHSFIYNNLMELYVDEEDVF